jgi:hypothetical protein
VSTTLTKDVSIWRCLGELAGRLGVCCMRVVDHWDADPFAVGVTRGDVCGRLVYISTYQQPAGRYTYECEQSCGEGVYDVTERAEGVSFEQLDDVIRHHLLIDR